MADNRGAIRVQRAERDELDVAFSLLARFFAEEGFQTAPDDLRRNLRGMLADSSCWVALAWRGQTAMGIGTVSTVRSTEAGFLAEIQDLYVLPEGRRAGVARALVGEAIEWSRAQGCSAVEVVITPEGEASHSLSQLYAKLAFQPTYRTIHSRELI